MTIPIDKIYKSPPSHTTTMECEHCKTKLESTSNFCIKCGKKVQEHIFDMDEGLRTHARFWFIAGVFKAFSLGKKEDPSIMTFEKLLKEKGDWVYDEYLEIIAHWRNQINLMDKHDIKL